MERVVKSLIITVLAGGVGLILGNIMGQMSIAFDVSDDYYVTEHMTRRLIDFYHALSDII